MRPIERGAPPNGHGDYPKYANARAGLIDRLGAYCSYCEMPLGASLAVEHVLPKSRFTALETKWDNYTLACTNCNSPKGSRFRLELVGGGGDAPFLWQANLYFCLWPQFDNTASIFVYGEGGSVDVDPGLDDVTKIMAVTTMALVNLDQLPGEEGRVEIPWLKFYTWEKIGKTKQSGEKESKARSSQGYESLMDFQAVFEDRDFLEQQVKSKQVQQPGYTNKIVSWQPLQKPEQIGYTVNGKHYLVRPDLQYCPIDDTQRPPSTVAVALLHDQQPIFEYTMLTYSVPELVQVQVTRQVHTRTTWSVNVARGKQNLFGLQQTQANALAAAPDASNRRWQNRYETWEVAKFARKTYLGFLKNCREAEEDYDALAKDVKRSETKDDVMGLFDVGFDVEAELGSPTEALTNAMDRAERRKRRSVKQLKAIERETVELAKAKGFWSVWMTIFNEEKRMIQLLIEGFPGTWGPLNYPVNGMTYDEYRAVARLRPQQMAPSDIPP